MVCGEVVGDITVEDGPDDTGTIVIHEGGMVRGTVFGRRVVVLGTVDGDVISSTHLTLGERGRITKNTYYRRILTADGGELEGYVRRIKDGMDPRKDLLARRSNGDLSVS
jgi:cytoskeletal protein CcmA (bactofilin family)